MVIIICKLNTFSNVCKYGMTYGPPAYIHNVNRTIVLGQLCISRHKNLFVSKILKNKKKRANCNCSFQKLYEFKKLWNLGNV